MEQENKRRHVPVSLVVFLGMLAAIAPLSTDMYLPALPEMMGNFNVSSSMVQLTLTFSMAGMAAGQLFAGPVSDEKGRRMPLLTAMVVFAVSTLGCFFSNTVYVFCAVLYRGYREARVLSLPVPSFGTWRAGRP